MKKLWPVLSLLFFPLFVSAHGVGQVYNLPIPLKYYLGAAGLAVAFSFFIFAFVLNTKSKVSSEKTIFIPGLKFIILVLKVISFFLMVLTIATGIFGSQNALHNFAPIFFWVFFLVGFGVLSLFFANFWHKLNPWKTLVELIGLKNKSGKKISGFVSVILLLALFWFELSSGQSFIPAAVGRVLFIYSLFNIIMASIYENWFEDGELFSVFYRFVGLLAFVRISDDDQSLITVPLDRRLNSTSLSWSSLGLTSVLLAGTSFDSFKETVLWYRIIDLFHYQGNLILPNTIGIILAPLPFLLLYLLIIWVMQKLTQVSDVKTLARRFVSSLIPIAFGYTLAHNFSLFIVVTPQFLGIILHKASLASYNLILGAKTIWFIEIGLVVLAHIIGTFFAHILATDIMPDQSKVLKSQYPMLVLMVMFTVTTLWLLSQPLTIGK